MKHVLFVDVRNATRSQMAEAWLNHLANGYAEARSCGTMPAERVGGRAVQAMKEVGMDIRTKRPHAISQQLMNWADILVILGTGIFPQALTPTHIWKFEDPTGKSIDEVRILRDGIRSSVEGLIVEIQKNDLEQIDLNQIYPNYLQQIRI
jgi:arsenate reductase